MIETIYGPAAKEVVSKASKVKLLICDVDGVFSDGRIYLGNNGEELKCFNTKDGFGIVSLVKAGFMVGVITGRNSAIVENRMKALGVQFLFQGQSNKLEAYQEMLQQAGVTGEQAAYIGDDTIDLPVMQQVELSVAVNDAHPIVRQRADYVTYMAGGFGAVRELTDLLLFSQGKLEGAQGLSI